MLCKPILKFLHTVTCEENCRPLEAALCPFARSLPQSRSFPTAETVAVFAGWGWWEGGGAECGGCGVWGGASAERVFQGTLSTSLCSGGPLWLEEGWGHHCREAGGDRGEWEA